MDIVVIFTCYNRKKKTETCIHTLVSGNPRCHFTFVVVDDKSTDGTIEMLKKIREKYDIHILHGNGRLFYSGGMRLGMQYVLQKCSQDYDYVLLINDDVAFLEDSIEKMVVQSKDQSSSIIVGVMCDDDGNLSYSAVKYVKGIKCRNLSTMEWEIFADTFCANCVLIPYDAFKKTGNMDAAYVHGMGDFDYGIMLRRNGYAIHASKELVGICNDNPKENSWMDISLGRRERIRRKESPKGLPTRQWFYFLKKNFGLIMAIRKSCTPYIKILFKK